MWATRSVVTRAAERKHLAARAAADPAAKAAWADQAAARRRLADLTLAPAPASAAARQARDEEMADLSSRLLRLAAALAAALAAVANPRYALLTFGPEGKDRVWLVHDGSDAL